MKRVFVLILALCMVLTGCGSSAKPISFEQFEEKYKRADWEILTNKPMEFIDDLNLMSGQPLDDWCKDLDSFEIESNGPTRSLKKEMILFNRPVKFSGTAFVYPEEKKFFSGSIHIDGTAEECYGVFLAMFEAAIKSKGDASELKIRYDEVDEVAFRTAISSGDVDSLSATWNTGDTEKDPTFGCSVYIVSEDRAFITIH